MLRFGGGCCCSCLYFADNFNRSGADVAADDVNLVGSDRWEFTSGDWEIQTVLSERQLVALTTDSPIYFWENIDRARKFMVNARVYLPNVSDHITLIIGINEITLTKTASNTFTITDGTETHTFKNYETYQYVAAVIVNTDDFPSLTPGTTKIVYAPSQTILYGSDCMTFEAGEDSCHQYGFQATTGVVIDNVNAYYSRETCIGYTDKACGTICDPAELPDSVTVTISGYVSQQSKCFYMPFLESVTYDDAVAICESSYTTAIADCLSNYPDTGSPEYYFCACTANSNRWDCLCSVYNYYTKCISSCPTASFNGTWILDKVIPDEGDPCTNCTYEIEVPIEDYYTGSYACSDIPTCYDSLHECDGNTVTGDSLFLRAHVYIYYYDAATGELTVSVEFEMPNGQKYFMTLTKAQFCEETTSETLYTATTTSEFPFEGILINTCGPLDVTEDRGCGVLTGDIGGDCSGTGVGNECYVDTTALKTITGGVP